MAALSSNELIRCGLAGVIVGLAYVAFGLLGNTTDIAAYGRSVFTWMVQRWDEGGGDMSHGWLIAPVSMGVVWLRRKDLRNAPKQISRIGLAVVVAALLLHWLGAKAQQTRLSLFGLILLIWGVPFYFYGWDVAKILAFPCGYLVFCVPLNFLDSITFPLRMIVTIVSTSLLNGLGIPVQRVGSAIYSTEAGGFSFDVADPCSGLRSLLAMTALMAVYAYLTQKTFLKKWILFAMCIPVAILGNIARITTVGLVARAIGEDLAYGLYHDYSGYIFFSVAIGLMVALGGFLSLNLRDVWKQWKQDLLNPISSSSASWS